MKADRNIHGDLDAVRGDVLEALHVETPHGAVLRHHRLQRARATTEAAFHLCGDVERLVKGVRGVGVSGMIIHDPDTHGTILDLT